MADLHKVTEHTNNEAQERMNKLVSEVTSEKPEEVSFLSRALVSTELTKDAIERGKISPEQGLEFARSLMDYNTVPVVIGTPECKLFPINLIIEARPAIVVDYRNKAQSEGIDFDTKSKYLKFTAQKIVDLLEIGNDWLAKIYGPFALSPKDAQTEIIKKVQENVAVRELLGDDGQIKLDQINAATSFMALNFSNFIAGQDLETHINDNYKFQ